VIGWATLFASIYFGVARYLAGAITIWFGVISHWLLDYFVHNPDLPLYAGGSRFIGMGLWNRRWITVAVELAMLLGGIAIYLFQTRAKDKIYGSVLFWVFVVIIVALYGAVVFGPPPPSVRKVAIGALVTLLAVPLAWWIDHHREPRADVATNDRAG